MMTTASLITKLRVRQPTFFLSHGGGPLFFMEGEKGDAVSRMMGPSSPIVQWYHSLAASLPAPPEAIVMISAHWEERPSVHITSAPAPKLLFDYYGFPKETYAYTYAAPGHPALAAKVHELLKNGGVPCELDAQRDWDHGIFIPLMASFPKAEIPVVQVSLHHSLDPVLHLNIGRLLEPLRDENILILGSGQATHNLRAFQGAMAGMHMKSGVKFTTWLDEVVTAAKEERWKLLTEWEKAPEARDAHPREEHLLPMMVVAGAAGNDAGQCVFRADAASSEMMAMNCYRFG